MNPEPISTPVTLDNCASEPIHIPGHIQPHGALLGFSPGGQLAYISATAADVLGVGVPALGQRMAAHDFADAGDVSQSISRVLSDHAPDGPLAIHAEVQLGGSGFDLIIHRSGDTVVAEFEKQPARAPGVGNFAILAHRGMDRLRRQESIQVLLEVAVDEVRKLTGFDRVMAYRFAPDGSGDVVAESRRADLTPYLNQRYPASDIPAQARRLYVISTLRLIADVGAAAVPVHGLGAVPLDMSHCVLRSVSPVHIEYLTNMGVGASLSISILRDVITVVRQFRPHVIVAVFSGTPSMATITSPNAPERASAPRRPAAAAGGPGRTRSMAMPGRPGTASSGRAAMPTPGRGKRPSRIRASTT